MHFSSILNTTFLVCSLTHKITAELSFTPRVDDDVHISMNDTDHPGEIIAATGDMMNRTRCYCRRPERGLRTTPTFGTYLAISYYNFYSKRLYSLEWTCKTHKTHSGPVTSTCSPLQNVAFWYIPGDFDFKGCAESGREGDQHRDKCCYTAQRQYGHRDAITFNGQKRKFGDEGRTMYETIGEVDAACELLCQEKVDPDMIVNRINQNPHYPIARNAIDTFYVDDMCLGCP